MKQLGEFLKTTIMGGLLVLFPLIACVFVILKLAGLLTSFIKPVLSFFVPQSRLMGVALADAASLLILILLCFLAGLVMKTSLGGALVPRVSKLLDKIPGYKVFVRVSRIVFDRDDASGTPVVVQRGENRQLGFMMEETGGEELTIFFPDAPGLFSGTVEIVKASMVERLNVPPGQVARVIATFGIGTRTLLANRIGGKNQ